MLDTQQLCAAIRRQPQTSRRIIPVPNRSLEQAQELAFSVCKGKSTARIISHGIEDLLLQFRAGSRKLSVQRTRTLQRTAETVRGEAMTNVGVTLDSVGWDRVQAVADATGLSPTATVRALVYIAMEQAHNELTDR